MVFVFKPGFYFGLAPFFSNPQININRDRIPMFNIEIVYKLHSCIKPKNKYILR